jgi:hypothetical protein
MVFKCLLNYIEKKVKNKIFTFQGVLQKPLKMAETKANGKTHAKEEEAEDVSRKLLNKNHFSVNMTSFIDRNKLNNLYMGTL